MKLTKGERVTLLLLGGVIAFLYVQHRRATAGAAAPAPAALPNIPGALPIPQQLAT